MDKVVEKLAKKYGDSKVFKAENTKAMEVLSTGVLGLDVATGVGGLPLRTITEIYGRESVGKSALAYYIIQEAHRRGGHAAYVNLESEWSSQQEWMLRLCPDIDIKRLLIVEPHPGEEAANLFAELIESAAFNVVIYDSVGAMSTDKELMLGQKKQAFGQSALVSQLAKQALFYARESGCIPIILNQVRDATAGTYVIEKAPGGHVKDHLSTIRIHLKPGTSSATIKADYQGEEIPVMHRVAAKIEKNKVGVPKVSTSWDFWNVESPDGIIGIDTNQSVVDTALQKGLITRGGAIYHHSSFPDGKIKGREKVSDFLKENKKIVDEMRKDLVMAAFKNPVAPPKETLVDVYETE